MPARLRPVCGPNSVRDLSSGSAVHRCRETLGPSVAPRAAGDGGDLRRALTRTSTARYSLNAWARGWLDAHPPLRVAVARARRTAPTDTGTGSGRERPDRRSPRAGSTPLGRDHNLSKQAIAAARRTSDAHDVRVPSRTERVPVGETAVAHRGPDRRLAAADRAQGATSTPVGDLPNPA